MKKTLGKLFVLFLLVHTHMNVVPCAPNENASMERNTGTCLTMDGDEYFIDSFIHISRVPVLLTMEKVQGEPGTYKIINIAMEDARHGN